MFYVLGGQPNTPKLRHLFLQQVCPHHQHNFFTFYMRFQGAVRMTSACVYTTCSILFNETLNNIIKLQRVNTKRRNEVVFYNDCLLRSLSSVRSPPLFIAMMMHSFVFFTQPNASHTMQQTND